MLTFEEQEEDISLLKNLYHFPLCYRLLIQLLTVELYPPLQDKIYSEKKSMSRENARIKCDRRTFLVWVAIYMEKGAQSARTWLFLNGHCRV